MAREDDLYLQVELFLFHPLSAYPYSANLYTTRDPIRFKFKDRLA